MRWLLTVAGAALALASSAGGAQVFGTANGSDRVDPLLTADAALGTLRATGLLCGRSTTVIGDQVISVFADRAEWTPGLETEVLPLTAWAVVDGRCRSRFGRPTDHDSVWDVRLTGPDTDIRLRGRRLLLAQLGTLGGWTEPS